MRAYIYALVERSTGLVIYVGMTTRNPKRRELEHRRTYRDITDVRLEVIEEVPPSENPREHEWWWVRELDRRGHRFLTNVRLRGKPPRRRTNHAGHRVTDDLDTDVVAMRQAMAAELDALGILERGPGIPL